jgi:3-hydroxyisobutyrate dehydrogenase
MSKSIAFLGLGVMGAPMTANLVRHGFSVRAWNRTPTSPGVAIAWEAGASITDTLAEAIASAEIIFTCVGDVPDVEAVILGEEGVIRYARSGAIVVDMSTIGATAARAIGAKLREKNLHFLDAPVSGGDIGACNGTLTIMVGGDEKDFTECLPCFQAMGKTIRLCGSIGSGQAVKLCNQVLGAIHMVALCEALKMAEIQDLDPNLVIEVCKTGAAGSWALENLGPKILQGQLEPAFMIEHILKDLRLVKETVHTSGEALPGTDLAESLFQIVAALDSGQGSKQGTQAMIRAYNRIRE